MFEIVVAALLDGGIGYKGKIPWHIPADLKAFKRLTVGKGNNAVIMGRKTFESLPDKVKPLPDRLNVVLSRNPDYSFPNTIVTASLQEAFKILESKHLDNVFVIGGGEVYSEAMKLPTCTRIHITRVHGTEITDTRFEIDSSLFQMTTQSPLQSSNGFKYSICVYDRKQHEEQQYLQLVNNTIST